MLTPLGAKLAAIETHVREARLQLALLQNKRPLLIRDDEIYRAIDHLRDAVDIFDGKEGGRT